ncbi:solute carrier family 12 member 9 isoform X1 [Coregonus clupeaformis]|uniref:solute carrier family 12 member 9 isoform X1 n=2 Tax=Coregonus clupeaformis TaxID=59861 RepID=UPI001E1C502E|nr:solute carrier family 12 member 9 isoform X1 [Coregonus clupeaformis]
MSTRNNRAALMLHDFEASCLCRMSDAFLVARCLKMFFINLFKTLLSHLLFVCLQTNFFVNIKLYCVFRNLSNCQHCYELLTYKECLHLTGLQKVQGTSEPLKNNRLLMKAMSNDHTPLLAHGVCGLSADTAVCDIGGSDGTGEASTPNAVPRKLNTFFGVIVPTVLSMFSIVLFLRTGFVVGHAGLLQGLVMLLVAYTIISLTILSICAISTNGAVQGGGAYFMISRSLGPEFGGSIGLMFFLAKVCACGVYVLGLVEALLDIFGQDPASSSALRVLPQGYWYTVLYSSIVLLLVLVVCLVGAHIFARTSFLILLVVTISLLSIYISPLAVTTPLNFLITHQGHGNQTLTYDASYTGFNSTTLKDNLGSGYTVDYSTGKVMSFATVFAVMFTSCTGIMAGANMSGELKNPSAAIPKGTIIAVLYTFIVYVLLFILASSTCERTLLAQDYGFFQRINIWPPFVTIGIYCSALSAAMCSLIGASRILHALALDQLFGFPLAPAAITSSSGNPWVAVLYTWGLAQCVVFAGQLNAIAGLVTVFYLLAYAAVDLACLALEWASAPNFRPTFQVFSWHTCLLGILSCLVMMFVINPVYSSASIVLLLLLLLFLHYRSPTSSWGYISQALIFHQVRKYLLMLDVRKDHVKFWRPQVLLMVANPRSSCQLINFVNQLKKGGLFVLGHVKLGDLDTLPSDPVQQQYNFWLSLVDKLGVKAFVDLTLSPSVRQGTQHLLRITGLGGMKPNTLVLGFYDSCTPEDYFLQDPAFCESKGSGGDDFGVDLPSMQAHFPPVRHVESPRWLTPEEYVGIISDAIKMSKNVCLGRYFSQLQGESMGTKTDGAERIIDVWPFNLLQPSSTSTASVDVCSLFLLQMACVLNMANRWRHARMRIFLCVKAESSDQGWVVKEETYRELLRKLRIKASIKIVPWDSVVQLYGQEQTQDPELEGLTKPAQALSEDFLSAVNSMLMEHSAEAAVRFLYLPRPPAHSSQSPKYLSQLEAVTYGLGPTLLIHGLTPVTCTEL